MLKIGSGLAGFALASVVGCSAVPPMASPVPGATNPSILASDLRLRVSILADDSLAGRETGSPGLRVAADYLAAEAARLGLRPAGDGGSYLQSVPLEKATTRAGVEVTQDGISSTLTSREILAVSGMGGLPNSSRLSGEGSLVFGGNLIDPSIGMDELDPSDLDGSVLILRIGVPEGVNPATAAPRMILAAALSPASTAEAVLLVAEETEAEFWDYAAEVAVKGTISRTGTAVAATGNVPPFFLVSPQVVEGLIGESLATARLPKTDLGRLEFNVTRNVETVDAWNVAAILPGRDPALANQYVGLGAHYDHVGIGEPLAGDSIYNGADDNASGTTGLLEIAEALAALPASEKPARSVLFVWNTGEEHGLLGSEYFTDHPTVPREAIMAHINIDMIGRNGADSVFVVGSRRISTELGELLEEVNDDRSRPFVFDYTFDAPGHPEMIYCRSDHYNYARYGIPIIFLTTGLHDQYHQPSDEMDLLDYDKMAEVSSLLFDVTRSIADRPSRLVVDQAVPPLGTPCQ